MNGLEMGKFPVYLTKDILMGVQYWVMKEC